MISNAKNKTISELSSAVPNVIEAVQELLQPITATVITKQQIAGKTEEIKIDICTRASIQPDDQSLAIKPEGQRMWKYWTLYCEMNLNLIPDQGFIIKGQGYRVIDKTDWSAYGYYKYRILEDYDVTG